MVHNRPVLVLPFASTGTGVPSTWTLGPARAADDGAVPLDQIIPADDPQPGGNAIADQTGRIADDRGVPQGDGANLEQESQVPIRSADDDIAQRAVLIEVGGIGRQ